MPDSRRPLGRLDITCIGVNAIVGSSIFLFPGQLAGKLGPASVLSFALVGALLVSVGLCFAEAASHFDRTGGPYLYARQAFGPRPGFAIGWLCWVTSIFSWAAVANAIAVYLGYFGDAFATAWAVKGTAAAVIAGLGALNYRGVKMGAWASNLFTAAKLVPLGLFIALGLPHLDVASFSPVAPHGWAPLGGACFLAYFAFQGFEVIPVPSGEVDNPRRSVPLVTVGSLVFAALLYMLVQAVAVGVHPGLASSERPLAEAAALFMGSAGAAMMVLGAVFSTTGFNAGTALVAPRYLVALAESAQLPVGLAALHPRYRTPHRAVLATTGLTLVAAMLLDFNRLVDFSNVVICAQYLATCAAIPFLRRAPSSARAFRLPGGYVLPATGIAATLWLGSQGGIEQVWWSLGILAFGFALRALSRRQRPA